MRERLKQWTAVASIVVVAGATLAACGDKDDSAEPSSSASTPAAGSSTDSAPSANSVIDKVAAAQSKAATSHVSMDVTVAAQKLTAEGDIKVGESAADTEMALTMKTGQKGAGSFEMRLVDQVFYLNFGPVTQNKFAKIDLTDRNNPVAQQYGQLLKMIDPAKQLAQLEGAVSELKKKGDTTKIDGVETQPYELVVDTAELTSLKGAPGSKLPKTLTYTMYVGPDDLPRRLVTEIPDIGGAGKSNLTIDYSQWGEKVSIDKPKASQISDQDPFGGLGQG